jgi:hypothetical protein
MNAESRQPDGINGQGGHTEPADPFSAEGALLLHARASTRSR